MNWQTASTMSDTGRLGRTMLAMMLPEVRASASTELK
jgi:hypothetical protein